jgi:hypothetical protein
MKQRKIHRVLGLFMILPLLAWALTGVIFLTKPGYEGAYERLSVKTYEIEAYPNIYGERGWEEIRLIRSVIGLHLLAKTNGTFKQYDLETFKPLDMPDEHQIKRLVSDAIENNLERYGVVDSIEGLKAYTNTGIEIRLDWDEMKLSQRGPDRAIIETLYKIHYLQWTKWEGVNLVLGIVGLICLSGVTVFGFSSYLSRKRK